MRSLFEEHFELLRAKHPSASYDLVPNGTRRIKIPDYDLPANLWKPPKTTIYFLILPSYPVAKPDCFWTSPELRLASGAMPQNASINNSHGGPENLLWFSWHADTWDPNRDNLLTYLKLIDRRLREPR